jgi:hypothetical protein
MKQIIPWSLFIFPLLSLIFLERSVIRRFMPVALFVTVINTLFYQAAYHYNWWKEPGIFGWDNVANVQWVYSAYLVATIWIFKFTYGRFWRYLIVNIVLDGIYIFVWYPVQTNLGMASGTMPGYMQYIIMIFLSLLIYVYQMWQEGEIFN